MPTSNLNGILNTTPNNKVSVKAPAANPLFAPIQTVPPAKPVSGINVGVNGIPNYTPSVASKPKTPTSVVSTNTIKNKVIPTIQDTISKYEDEKANSLVKSQTVADKQSELAKINANAPTFTNDTGTYRTETRINDRGETYTVNIRVGDAPKTPEQKIADEAPDGFANYYNANGEKTILPASDVTPAGYSKVNPKERTDVLETADVGGGTSLQIKKFADGTYGRFNLATGDYTPATAGDFQSAKSLAEIRLRADNARNGIFDATQQKKIDSIVNDYEQKIAKQTQANSALTAAATAQGYMSGTAGSLMQAGIIYKTITTGLEAITNLANDRDKAVSDMKIALASDDATELKNAFTSYQLASQQIQSGIDKLQLYTQQQADKITLKNQSYAIQMATKYSDTTEPILPTDSMAEVKAKLKTSLSYQNELKQKQGIVGQDELDGILAIYRKTGAIPTGLNAKAQVMREAFYKAIGNNPNAVDEAASNKASLSGATKALATQRNQLSGAKTSIATLDKTIDLAEEYSNKVDRTGIPFADKYTLYLKGKIKGDADTAAFQTLVKTAAFEYAKIMSGSASSISGATVNSTQEAESFINAEMSKGQIQEVFDILRKDAKFRVESQQDEINTIQEDIKKIGNGPTSTSSSSTAGNPTGGIVKTKAGNINTNW